MKLNKPEMWYEISNWNDYLYSSMYKKAAKTLENALKVKCFFKTWDVTLLICFWYITLRLKKYFIRKMKNILMVKEKAYLLFV